MRRTKAMSVNEFAAKLSKYMTENPDFDILKEDKYEILIKMLNSDYDTAIKKLMEEDRDENT